MAMMGDAVLMVQGGPDEGNSINLPKGMLVMGRGPLNDVVLDDTGVSRQHAGIRGGTEGYWIADLGSQNGTFVNGERLGADPRRLQNFDKIELGGTSTSVHWLFMESQATTAIPVPPREQ